MRYYSAYDLIAIQTLQVKKRLSTKLIRTLYLAYIDLTYLQLETNPHPLRRKQHKANLYEKERMMLCLPNSRCPHVMPS